MPASGAMWRAEIDAVEFHVDGGYRFVVHRNVFRTLRGPSPTPEICLAFVEANADAFLVAARTRIAEAMSASTSAATMAFHLNSRQVRRAMADALQRDVVPTEPARR
ncbi:hypothetical protein [Rhizobium sp. 9140]|uniref:hypothetical protein n=1 Tax=Rhizobium sp. 9140 TaxID=1761900 RepID=UPI000792AE07|nr:hypothetical protein [Rhizobium sp. 9140]CZT36049.1 hypothetical protein GA0004734_00030540 [Rhizobium sp. 9140]